MTLPAPYPGTLTDIAGLMVGHAAAPGRPTGCTVVLCPQGAVAGAAVRGGAPGTRETDLLRPESTGQQVHAVLLTGGSAFGLDAAGGVMRWLDERGHGLAVGATPAAATGTTPGVATGMASDAATGVAASMAPGVATGMASDAAPGVATSTASGMATGTAVAAAAPGLPIRVPIVPAAVLFDLGLGDPRIRPDAGTGYAACEAASTAAPAQGNAGAGLGASVGKLYGLARAMKGGIGSASLCQGGVQVAALVAVNAIGDVLDERGEVIAGARSEDGLHLAAGVQALLAGAVPARPLAGTATTIGVVATDAVLDKAQATQLAALAHHGLARAVNPITAHDGDAFFVLATGTSGAAGDMVALGALAAEVVSRAIRNAVRAAVSLPATAQSPALPAACDLRAPRR